MLRVKSEQSTNSYRLLTACSRSKSALCPYLGDPSTSSRCVSAMSRGRVRSFDGEEMALPTRTAAQGEDWLGCWGRSLQAIPGNGTSKSAAWRGRVALSAARLAEWMASEPGQRVGAGRRPRHQCRRPHAVGLKGQPKLIERGLDPEVCRLFMVDGTKALSRSSVEPSVPTRRSSVARFTKRPIAKGLLTAILFYDAGPKQFGCPKVVRARGGVRRGFSRMKEEKTIGQAAATSQSGASRG
jgi:hypothetical protein